MGICEPTYMQSKSTEESKTNEIFNKNQSLKINEIKNNRIEECMAVSSSFEKIDPYIANVSKSICKIKIENGTKIISGIGFLLKIEIDQESFYCLMSNEHVINQDIINNNTIIYIYYDNEFKIVNIKLDKNKRYTKTFKDIGLDITVVEILDDDNISKDYYLLNDEYENINNRLINSKIYIPQYIYNYFSFYLYPILLY